MRKKQNPCLFTGQDLWKRNEVKKSRQSSSKGMSDSSNPHATNSDEETNEEESSPSVDANHVDVSNFDEGLLEEAAGGQDDTIIEISTEDDDLVLELDDNVDDEPVTDPETDSESSSGPSPAKKSKHNRCLVCRKRLGLTGLECRCGGLYCALHIYSDKHDCTFDYKQAGADEIRKNNPVVVSEKITKI